MVDNEQVPSSEVEQEAKAKVKEIESKAKVEAEEAEEILSQIKKEAPGEKKVVVKIKKKGPVRKFFKFFVDVKKWSSYDEVSANVKVTLGLFRRLIARTGEARHETYEEAIGRLGLTNEQIEQRRKGFLYSTLVFLAFEVVFIIYFFYLLFNSSWWVSLFMLMMLVLMAMLTYREHFWYMQMTKKKLGCSFQDWLNFILRRSQK